MGWTGFYLRPFTPLSDSRFAYKNPPEEASALTGTVIFNSRTDNEQHIKRIA